VATRILPAGVSFDVVLGMYIYSPECGSVFETYVSRKHEWNMGKGSTYRPCNKKRFDRNFEKIFGKQPLKHGKKKKKPHI
jgi:hypothetical protein